jgi:hypothetical protein
MAPPGNASATPGAKYSPISTDLTLNSPVSSGATAATLCHRGCDWHGISLHLTS